MHDVKLYVVHDCVQWNFWLYALLFPNLSEVVPEDLKLRRRNILFTTDFTFDQIISNRLSNGANPNIVTFSATYSIALMSINVTQRQ